MRRTVLAAAVAGVMASAVLSPTAGSSPRSYAHGHFMLTLDPTPLPAPGDANLTVVTVELRAVGIGAALGVSMITKDTRALPTADLAASGPESTASVSCEGHPSLSCDFVSDVDADAAEPLKPGVTGPKLDAQLPGGPSTSVSVEITGSSESQGVGLPKFDLDLSMEGAGSTIK